MNKNAEESAKISFSYDDNQRSDEIIALKQLLFCIIRNLPHETGINIVKTIQDKNNPAYNRLCLEITEAMISTTEVID